MHGAPEGIEQLDRELGHELVDDPGRRWWRVVAGGLPNEDRGRGDSRDRDPAGGDGAKEGERDPFRELRAARVGGLREVAKVLSPREIARDLRAKAEHTREIARAALPNQTDERHDNARSDSRAAFAIGVGSGADRPCPTA